MRAHLSTFGFLLLGGALLGVTGCGSTARTYCEKASECSGDALLGLDPAGDAKDSADVCTIEQQGNLDALRANSEDICLQLADAYETYMNCAIEQGCDAFEIFNNPCSDQLQDILDLSGEAGNRCSE